MNLQYEREIIRRFIEKEKKERFLYFLSNPKHQNEAVLPIVNTNHFNTDCLTQLAKKPELEELYSRLQEMGAGKEAYLVSRYESMHGQVWPLRLALEKSIGQTAGTFVYCFEGKVGYYEEDGQERFFIVHEANRKHK